MNRRASIRPSLELLEDRRCPSASAMLSHGSLIVTDDQTASLAITEIQDGTFRVTDQGNLIGTYTVHNAVSVQLTGVNNSIVINLDGQTTPGDIDVHMGAGTSQLRIENGTVSGDLNVYGGQGSNTVTLGGPQAAPAPLQVNHDTYIQLNGSPDDTLRVNSGVTLNGDLTAVSANNVTLADGSAVEHSAIFSGGPAGNSVELDGMVAGLARFTGSALRSDQVTVGSSAVLGSMVVVLGDGASDVAMDGKVLGKFFLQAGNGSDRIDLAGSIGGATELHLGNGTDTVDISGTITGADAVSALLIRGNGGSDTLTLEAGSVVNGNADIKLGSQADTATLAGTVGSVSLDTGAGNDSVAFASSLVVNGSASVCLDAGDDTFTLADGAQFQSATINGGTGNDTFVGDASRVVLHGFETIINPDSFHPRG